ncbi:hypothetical protein [Aeoliella sp.]|uniref:hypothetical protein n=1 Tax=Aeoliella sp. TaxID=2795800 RepID=UPI003CCBE02D
MGKIFTYITDEVLSKYAEPGTCDWCNTDSGLYRIYIEVEGDMGDRACLKCIKSLPLRWILPKDDERIIGSLINERYPKGTKSQSQRFARTVEMCDDCRRTPRLPNFIQNDDWPQCCAPSQRTMSNGERTYDDIQSPQ